jgi:hypothetical protein
MRREEYRGSEIDRDYNRDFGREEFRGREFENRGQEPGREFERGRWQERDYDYGRDFNRGRGQLERGYGRDWQEDRGYGGAGQEWRERAWPGYGFGYGPYTGGASYGTYGGYGGYWGGGMGTGQVFGRQRRFYGERSDEEIRREVYDRIDDDPRIPENADIHVEVNEGEVTLTGEVRHRNAKQALWTAVWQVDGVEDVHNNVRVNSRRRQSMSEPSARGQAGQQGQHTGQQQGAETRNAATAGRSR